ncbi:helix-turn-helix domain-containing protein [Paenibacillus azoreducens]|uniref:XRE family transcriptional regulator n=1 Tax=Paenibacillus azoreducens TaxID=116718 RepID=A0A920CT28_9BACL|nr:helix-turn-helix transcriptional regulator [Paenibacillus azoreducens]GIO48028.1 hypothetical protein J34TS1_27930 [Paenibacillus azoreducens]
MSLGLRLKQLRKENKITQRDLSLKLGIDHTTVSKWEADVYEPDTSTLNKLADLFDVSVDYLLGRTNIPRPFDYGEDIDPKELAEFEEFINNPYHGIFFKDYLEAPEERKKELLTFWRFIREEEKDRKPGDRQGE